MKSKRFDRSDQKKVGDSALRCINSAAAIVARLDLKLRSLTANGLEVPLESLEINLYQLVKTPLIRWLLEEII